MADYAELAFQMAGLAGTITNPSLHRVVGGEKSFVLSIPQAVLMGEMLLEASQALSALGSGEFNEGVKASHEVFRRQLQALVTE